MTSKQSQKITKRLTVWALVIGVILMIPFLAKAPWTASDFIFAAIVLFGCASVYEFATRNMKNNIHKIAAALAVIFFIFLVMGWAAAGPANEAELLRNK